MDLQTKCLPVTRRGPSWRDYSRRSLCPRPSCGGETSEGVSVGLAGSYLRLVSPRV